MHHDWCLAIFCMSKTVQDTLQCWPTNMTTWPWTSIFTLVIICVLAQHSNDPCPKSPTIHKDANLVTNSENLRQILGIVSLVSTATTSPTQWSGVDGITISWSSEPCLRMQIIPALTDCMMFVSCSTIDSERWWAIRTHLAKTCCLHSLPSGPSTDSGACFQKTMMDQWFTLWHDAVIMKLYNREAVWWQQPPVPPCVAFQRIEPFAAENHLLVWLMQARECYRPYLPMLCLNRHPTPRQQPSTLC